MLLSFLAVSFPPFFTVCLLPDDKLTCICAGGADIKMVLLHEHKHEDGIRNFFLDIWEAYLKVTMNPFQDPNAIIENSSFDARVRAAAKKFL